MDIIAGVDEVGRGPLAGPVIAAAVILDPNNKISGLTDSKTLSRSRRQCLATAISQNSLAIGIGRSEPEEIDECNILQASLRAMLRAIECLPYRPSSVLIDGNHAPRCDFNTKTIVKGDLLIPEISAASIIAKVYRDKEMIEMDRNYPGYGFSKNMGYPTKSHLAALSELGPCPIHRLSFRPVANQCVNNG